MRAKSADATLSNEANLGALADNSVLAVDVSAGTATPRAGLFADIVALFGGGSCSGYIKSDGTCDSGAGGGAGFLFNCVSPTTATASATNFCIGATLNSNEGRAQFQIPRNCTLGALRVRTSSSTGAPLNLAGGTLTVTVRNGASDSALTCTVADGTSSCSDLAHTEAATAGAFSSLKLVGTGYSSAPYAQVSFECQ